MFTYFQRGMPIKCLGHNRKKIRPKTDWNFNLWNGNDDKAEVVWLTGRFCKTLEQTGWAQRFACTRSSFLVYRSQILTFNWMLSTCLVRSSSKRRNDGANRDWVTAMCCDSWRGFSAGVVSFKGTVSGRWAVSLPGACRTLQHYSYNYHL